jgi:branched-chain amino acid transport system permease protein
VSVGAVVLATGGGAALVALAGAGAYTLFIVALVAIQIIAVLSLNLLMGYAGQVSLGQAALVGIGAYAAAQFAAWGLPFPLVIPAGALATGAVAAVIGLPSLRIRGLQLAATTLAFGVVAERLLFARPWDRTSTLGVAAPRPAFVAGDRAFLVLVLVCLLTVALLDGAVRRSRVGRAFRAVRDREDTAAARGVAVASTKLQAYALSGVYAGVAGACFAFLLERVTPAPFTVWASLGLVATVVVGGLGSFSGAVVAGAAFTGLPELLRSAATLTPLVGALLLMVVPIVRPEGLGWLLDRPLPGAGLREHRRGRRRRTSRASAPASAAPAVAGPSPPEPAAVLGPVRRPVPLVVPVHSLLTVDGVEVAFGGNQVLRGAGFEVGRRESVGLIGPNGAGKTTLFNCISGFTRPSAGAIRYRGRDLLALPPEARAWLGMGRTFQQVGLSGPQTVWENMLLAGHVVAPYGTAAALVRAPSVRRAEAEIAGRAEAALALVGAADLAGVRVADLPHGSQRLVEVAAALAAGPDLLLLDEPAAGMGADEAAALAALLQELRASLGLTLVVIDHHVPFVTSVCDRVYVLVEGAVATVGPPEQIRRDPAVAAIYLGETAEEVAAHA